MNQERRDQSGDDGANDPIVFGIWFTLCAVRCERDPGRSVFCRAYQHKCSPARRVGFRIASEMTLANVQQGLRRTTPVMQTIERS